MIRRQAVLKEINLKKRNFMFLVSPRKNKTINGADLKQVGVAKIGNKGLPIVIKKKRWWLFRNYGLIREGYKLDCQGLGNDLTVEQLQDM